MQLAKTMRLILKIICLLFVAIWPGVVLITIMSSGGPGMPANILNTFQYAFDALLCYPPVLVIVLWFDRERYRSRGSAAYSLSLWSLPCLILVISCGLFTYAMFQK